jgi:hypothetical protein
LLKKPLAISAFGELDASVVSGDGGPHARGDKKAVGVEEY